MCVLTRPQVIICTLEFDKVVAHSPRCPEFLLLKCLFVDEHFFSMFKINGKRSSLLHTASSSCGAQACTAIASLTAQHGLQAHELQLRSCGAQA